MTADGGIFAFGDATFDGSLGAKPLASPLAGMARSVNGTGYWIAEQNGQVFNFGDAETFGQIGKPLNEPVVAMAPMH